MRKSKGKEREHPIAPLVSFKPKVTYSDRKYDKSDSSGVLNGFDKKEVDLLYEPRADPVDRLEIFNYLYDTFNKYVASKKPVTKEAFGLMLANEGYMDDPLEVQKMLVKLSNDYKKGLELKYITDTDYYSNFVDVFGIGLAKLIDLDSDMLTLSLRIKNRESPPNNDKMSIFKNSNDRTSFSSNKDMETRFNPFDKETPSYNSYEKPSYKRYEEKSSSYDSDSFSFNSDDEEDVNFNIRKPKSSYQGMDIFSDNFSDKPTFRQALRSRNIPERYSFRDALRNRPIPKPMDFNSKSTVSRISEDYETANKPSPKEKVVTYDSSSGEESSEYLNLNFNYYISIINSLDIDKDIRVSILEEISEENGASDDYIPFLISVSKVRSILMNNYLTDIQIDAIIETLIRLNTL